MTKETKTFLPLSSFPNFLWRGMHKRVWPGIRFIFTGRCPKTCQLLPASKWRQSAEEIVGYKNNFPPNFFSEEVMRDLER